MRRTLLCSVALLINAALFAQMHTEGFETTPYGSVPNDWIVTSSSDVAAYSRPYVCASSERGLLTPGVGKTAPLRLILPAVTYDGVSPNYVFSFFVSVLDPNLECNSAKLFACNTFVKAYLVDESWFTSNSKSFVLNSNNLPPASLIYAEEPNYEILNSNDNNTIVFNITNPGFTTGKKFRVLLDFKTATSSNCTASGTKFMFDDFGFKQLACTNCAPTTNDDYFNASIQSFTNIVKGNLFGGNAQWLNEISAAGYNAFLLNSLNSGTAVNNGDDYDPASTALTSMTYSLVPNSVVVSGTCPNISITPIVNQNGTFTVDRGSNVCISQISFMYQLTNNINGQSSTAKATIIFPANSTLPVSFSSFTAARNKSTVALKWETASEINNRGFYVQRNTDGTWKDVAFVFSQADGGNSASLLTYQFNDPNNTMGVTQYRIMQVDLDGQVRFSEIRTVQSELQAAKILLFPNPSSNGTVNVVFDEKASLKDVTLSDMSGRVIKQWNGITGESLVIENLQTGIYNIRVTNRTNATMMVEKFIVQKR